MPGNRTSIRVAVATIVVLGIGLAAVSVALWRETATPNSHDHRDAEADRFAHECLDLDIAALHEPPSDSSRAESGVWWCAFADHLLDPTADFARAENGFIDWCQSFEFASIERVDPYARACVWWGSGA